MASMESGTCMPLYRLCSLSENIADLQALVLILQTDFVVTTAQVAPLSAGVAASVTGNIIALSESFKGYG